MLNRGGGEGGGGGAVSSSKVGLSKIARAEKEEGAAENGLKIRMIASDLLGRNHPRPELARKILLSLEKH